MNEVLQAIYDRRSVRAFKPQQVKEDDLTLILEAGRQAPSAKNGQPWHFTVVQRKSLSDRIGAAAKEAYAKDPEFAKKSPWMLKPEFNLLYGAPTVVWVSGEASNPNAQGDCGIAVENMAIAAHSLGLNSCIIISALPAFATKNGPTFIKDLGIPEGFKPMYAFALGYTAAPLPAPAPRKEDCVNYVR
ncbi:MAG: nitroreductase [Clostridiales bacterium]|jgi:nitroreductase|nr:nitroreductase [Clostridiales bacterium]